MKRTWFVAIVLAGILAASGCGSSSSSSTEDSSTSGSVAAAVGGGVNGSSSGGDMSMRLPLSPVTQLFAWLGFEKDAFASTACPTFSSSALNSTLTYSNCSFSGSSAVWNGGVSFSGTLSSVTRLVTNGTTRTAASGTVVTINTSGSTLTPFNGDTAPSGGTTWTSSSLAINGVGLAAASASGTTLFKHVLTTNSTDGGSTLTISGGSVSGKVVTYHQLAYVKATSTLTGLTFSSSCCLPTGGTISTTFATSDSRALSKYNGATETLQITGCGTATYTGPEGYSGSVTLAHCL